VTLRRYRPAMDDFVKLMNGISGFISALVVPLAVVLVFRMFRIEINALIHRANRVAIKGGPVDISIEAQQAEAADAIAAAVTKAPDEEADPKTTAMSAAAAASTVTRTVTPTVVEQASASTILWVDDHPDNNVYERRALEAIGATFILATSTKDALAKAHSQAFDVVISDMSRGIERTAGYDLLDKLRAAGIQTPVIIYAATTNPERRAEAKRHGAVDATNRPDELFQLVVSMLNTRP
jgi:CheY-like chemotaxis protein